MRKVTKYQLIEFFESEKRRFQAFAKDPGCRPGIALWFLNSDWINEFIHEVGSPKFVEWETHIRKLCKTPIRRTYAESEYAEVHEALNALIRLVSEYLKMIRKSPQEIYMTDKPIPQYSGKVVGQFVEGAKAIRKLNQNN